MAATVLLVDYDPRSAERLRKVLAGVGMDTLVATDGRAGVEEFRRALPQLTLVQDLMPRLHGFDVCREIKGTEEGRSRAVVLLASRVSHATLVRTGCDAYLQKPFVDESLLELIRHFVR